MVLLRTDFTEQKGTWQVRASHVAAAAFDDPNRASCAGLLPVLELAERAGLHDLVAHHVRVDRPVPRAVPRELLMPLSHRLPRPEFTRQVPPRNARAVPVDRTLDQRPVRPHRLAHRSLQREGATAQSEPTCHD
jgi:hypothetical protein